MPHFACHRLDRRNHFGPGCPHRLFLELHANLCVVDVDRLPVHHERNAFWHVVELSERAIFHLDDNAVPVDVNNFTALDGDLPGCFACVTLSCLFALLERPRAVRTRYTERLRPAGRARLFLSA